MHVGRLAVALGVALAGVFMSAGALCAQEHEYTGAKKCGMCHNAPDRGSQLDLWKKTKHARAHATLATDEAKLLAKKVGVADPQKDGKCLKCHVTAHGVKKELLGSLFKVEDGVQCEACHGPGGDYGSKDVMESREESIKNGMIVPDEKLCKTCHNAESPTFKGFDFAAGSREIAHKKKKK